MQQQRFIIFLVIAVGILFGWNYLFPVKRPVPTDANANVSNQQAQTSPSVLPTQSPTQNPIQPSASPLPAVAENVEHRELTIEAPLYRVKFDNRGAVVTSWILTKDKWNGRELWSVASTKQNKVPLELISQIGLDPTTVGLPSEKREVPLRIVTGDATVDSNLANRNYSITGVDQGISTVKIGAGENKTIQFSLHDESTGVDVVKSLTFAGDFYNVEMKTSVSKGGQALPQAKMSIGPNIGDQNVPKYTFYSYAPEGVASTDGGNSIQRFAGKTINELKGSPDLQNVNGNIDWASIGDTYFSMVVIPSKQVSGLEYKTAKYEKTQPDGKKEVRYLVSGYVPVPTDGSLTVLYVGPKDHEILKAADAQISAEVQKPIDLDGLFNYGFFATVKRALAYPILTSINWFQKITGSYGVAIILFTIVLYSLFFPLKWRSSKSMKKAQKLAPRMKELQAKIKGMKKTDPKLQDLQKEQLLLMKEGNPLGGCLPLLIQMPFLYALYSAITVSIDFRQAGFLWIPDLSSGDPYHILEISMAASMVILQLVTPAPSADPMQRKMMAFTMPVFMLWILWGAPAGLLVYWLVGNVVGFSQQFLINYLTKTDNESTPENPPGSVSTKKLNSPRVSTA